MTGSDELSSSSHWARTEPSSTSKKTAPTRDSARTVRRLMTGSNSSTEGCLIYRYWSPKSPNRRPRRIPTHPSKSPTTSAVGRLCEMAPADPGFGRRQVRTPSLRTARVPPFGAGLLTPPETRPKVSPGDRRVDELHIDPGDLRSTSDGVRRPAPNESINQGRSTKSVQSEWVVAVAVQPAWRSHKTLGNQSGSVRKRRHLVPLRGPVCKQTRPPPRMEINQGHPALARGSYFKLGVVRRLSISPGPHNCSHPLPNYAAALGFRFAMPLAMQRRARVLRADGGHLRPCPSSATARFSSARPPHASFVAGRADSYTELCPLLMRLCRVNSVRNRQEITERAGHPHEVHHSIH